jgi:polyhydroxyalkanoate synthesis regulator phasin
MRQIPETANRSDWPRLVAQAINALLQNTASDKAATKEEIDALKARVAALEAE